MADNGRRDTPVFFIFDHNMLKKEDDDLKDAILYFCPEEVSADDQCELCGQLMGMVEYLNNTISRSTPQIFKFEHQKFAVKHVGIYSLGIQSRSLDPDTLLMSLLTSLYETFVFYHGSIDSLRLRNKDDNAMFLQELHSIWRTILGVSGQCLNAGLSQTFRHLPYLQLPKSSSHLFLQACQLLQASQKRPYVLAGAIFYNNRVLSTQLPPGLTRQLTFLQKQMPHIARSTDLDLPVGCRIITVFLTEDELSNITPPDPLAHRDCRITDFSSRRESEGPSRGQPQSGKGRLSRRLTVPNFGTNHSVSQSQEVSDHAMKSFLTKESRTSQNRNHDSLNVERFTWGKRTSSTSLSHVPIVECRSGESPVDFEKQVLGHGADETHFSDNYNETERKKVSDLRIPSSTSSATTDNDEPHCEPPMKFKSQKPNKPKEFDHKLNNSKNIRDNLIQKLNKLSSKHASVENKSTKDNKHISKNNSIDSNMLSLETNIYTTSLTLPRGTTFSGDPISKYASTANDGNAIQVTVDVHRDGDTDQHDETDTPKNTSLHNILNTSLGFDITDTFAISSSLNSADFCFSKDHVNEVEHPENYTQVEDNGRISGHDINDAIVNTTEDKSEDNMQSDANETTTGYTNSDSKDDTSINAGRKDELDKNSQSMDLNRCKESHDELASETDHNSGSATETVIDSFVSDTGQDLHSHVLTDVSVPAITEGTCDGELSSKTEKQSDRATNKVNAHEAEMSAEKSIESTKISTTAVRPDNLNLVTLKQTADVPGLAIAQTQHTNSSEEKNVFKVHVVENIVTDVNAKDGGNLLSDYLTETDDETKESHNPCINCLELNSKHPNASNELIIAKCPQCLSKSNSYKILNPYGERKEVIDFGESKDMTDGKGLDEGQHEAEGQDMSEDTSVQTGTPVQMSTTQGVSFTSSFSSDVSTDSTISRYWTHEMDGLNDVTLYVQCHSDISLLLLIENPDKYEENLLHSLWKGSLSDLADLDYHIKECMDHSDEESPTENYRYVKFDTYLKQLKGNVPDKNDPSHGRIHQAMSTLHADFQNHHCLTDVTLKSQTMAMYGHRNYVDETYFRLDQPQKLSSGLPIDRDPSYSLDNIARQRLSRDKHISLL